MIDEAVVVVKDPDAILAFENTSFLSRHVDVALNAEDAAFLRWICLGGRPRSSSGSPLSVSHLYVLLKLKHVEELVVTRGAADQQDSVIRIEVDVQIALSHELFGTHLAA